MRKITKMDEARMKVLYETGAISQAELSKLFKLSHERVSEIVRKKK